MNESDSVTLWQGDCLDLMGQIPDGSVDMVLCDLPYGTTSCPWDVIIPLEPLWAHYQRIIRPEGAIVLTSCHPFTAVLVTSNLKWYRYELIWEKENATGFLDANRKPMRCHENILVFAKGRTTYEPQMSEGEPYVTHRKNGQGGSALTADPNILYNPWTTVNEGTRYPRSVLKFAHDAVKIHPTQKPVPLLEYLIRTYSEPGQLIVDNTMGVGSTGVAAVQTGRRFLGIELDESFFQIAALRIADAQLHVERPHAPAFKKPTPPGPTPRSLFAGLEVAS